jgi:uncharacterized repeat protein (TIGR03803 family)
MHSHKFAAISRAALPIILLSLTLASSAWAAEYKVLYKFRPPVTDGHNPGGLTFDVVGNLYGTTSYGGDTGCYYGYGCGTVFKLAKNQDGTWTEKVLYSFTGGADGNQLWDGSSLLVTDAAGNLYGTARYGGDFSCDARYGCGVVFKLAPNPDGSWRESVLHTFSGLDGRYPWGGGLIFDSAGNLYGTTCSGGNPPDCIYGAGGCGVVFKLAPNPDGSWTESALYSFTGGFNHDGALPIAGLVFDAAGNLYGTTSTGSYGSTVFKLTPNQDGTWTHGLLYNIGGEIFIKVGVIFDADGNLFGASYNGGIGFGTVFKLTANPDGSWAASTLHVFKGTDGAGPSGLIFDAAGNLYGTTYAGGAYDSGTVFRLRPQPNGHWKRTTPHLFKSGQHPAAGLVMDAAGSLYGTTLYGGKGYGVVFQIIP